MKLIEPMRVWWQQRTGEEETPFDGDTPAWVISMVVHATLLVIFAMVALGPVEPTGITLEVITEPEEEELAEIDPPQEVFFDDAKIENIGAMSEHGTAAAMATAAVEAEESVVLEMETVALTGDLVFEAAADIAKAPNVSPNRTIKGTVSGVGSEGAEGAVDRITHEILLSLEQRKTLVVWMFDRTISLQRQRDAIRERFDRIYEELGVLEAADNPAFAKHEDKPLLTSVVSFGESYALLTPKPTDKVEEIKSAVEKIETDNSGVERVFAAVHETAKQFRAYRTQEPRRNVMIVVVTDEAGDDQDLLDATVDQCRKYQMPIYVVGIPAPFGRKLVDIKYVDPDPQYDQSEQWLPVHQGPESFLPEGIKLAFSADEREEPIDSGFGPYGLTRLCYETGGIYFAVHPNRNKGGKEVDRRDTAELAAHLKYFFDPQIMRRYQPDYVSTDEYKKLIMENKARAALVQAANLSGGAGMASPALVFPKEGEAEFANLLSEAQQQAAKLEPRVDQLYQTLAVGEGDRPKLTQPRWQAGYDLAMGRTLAVMVRTKVYNGMLAKAKQGMKFENEKNDTWKLVPADEVSVGSALEKQAEQARMYLNRVVKDHAGTPWAMLAAKELENPIGFKWEEEYTGVQAMKDAIGDGGDAAAQANDKAKAMVKPKQTRRPQL
jgi:hypothetical protein